MGLVAAGAAATLGPLRLESRRQAADIVSCVIHPAFGIARVGNSPDELFLGPEAPGPHPEPAGGFKDPAGRVKRQAARFRVYGLDADGNVVKELTEADAEITWTVHLANTKAAWYEFDTAFDIPPAKGEPPAAGVPAGPPLQTPRRNKDVTGAERGRLVIDPGPRTIRGGDVNPAGGDPRYAFTGGRFFERDVPLGELRTDGAGRLLVLGGFGNSGARAPGAQATTFANNDGWYDDTSDGPVEATVRVGGRVLEATGAWVVVAPPNYAPGIRSVVTMYDLMFEVATRLEPHRKPPRPSFTRQIYPLFERHVQHQWVNAGFLRDFGWGSAGDFLAPETLARLADPSAQTRVLREQLFRRFRDPAYTTWEENLLPPYYGDGMSLPPTNPRHWMAVLPIQYEWLRQWAEGDFDADWPAGGPRFPERLEDLPVAEQPDALDRAALDECLGGPFHPGCEMTWPVRLTSMYASAFRLRRRTAPEPDWGEVMTSAIALAPDGPLTASGPGDLTRWMAVPWQTDTSSCLSAYIREVDEYLPTFWPARVPNDVLALQNYLTVMDGNAGPERRGAAFAERIKWLRTVPANHEEAVPFINNFIREWSRYGIITRHPGPADRSFPDTFWVEVGYDRDGR